MLTDDVIAFTSWYEDQCRPFLEHVEPQKVKGFDDDIQRLRALRERSTEDVVVCFLGNAAIGKSTLINALVSGTKSLLPAGGLGPLTAQATQVRYASKPYLKVNYHPYKEFSSLIYALDTHHRNQLKKSNEAESLSDPTLQTDLSEEETKRSRDESARQQAESMASGGSDVHSEEMQGKVRQASLMVTGEQDKEKNIPYLIDCLLVAAQKPSHWGYEPREEDAIRILGLSKAIAISRANQPYNADEQDDAKGFLRKLAEHASGFLAPMIKELEVGWPSPLLKEGLVLVDLPGIGIAGDSYQEITRLWIRNRARAIVMVVDRGGVNEGCAEILYNNGFITRLLHSVDDPESDPVRLLVAVTRVDDVAATDYRAYKESGNSPPRKKHFFLTGIRAKMPEIIQRQMKEQLLKLGQSNHELTSASQLQIVDILVKGMSVHSVSAPEYSKFLIGDDDERPFIKEEGESGIPGLASALTQVACDWKAQLEEQEGKLFEHFHNRLAATLKAIYSRLREITTKEDEAEAILFKLNTLLNDLRPPFHARLGKFHEFLTSTLQEKLKQGIEESASAARKDLRQQVDWFDKNVHWATLRAAIRRRGVFSGSSEVDLVNTFSLKFEDPIATIWNENILKPLKTKTAAHTKAYTSIIKNTHEWALQQDLKEQSSRINAEYDELKLSMEHLQFIGDESIQELRTQVQQHLTEEIERAVRAGCTTFVESNKDEGAGVKQRMIDFLKELVSVISNQVQQITSKYLLAKIDKVRTQIASRFEEIGDPFELIIEIFKVTTQEIHEEEKEQRRRFSEQLQSTLEKVPPSFAFSFEVQTG